MKIDIKNANTSIPLMMTLFAYFCRQSIIELSASSFEFLGDSKLINKYVKELCDDQILYEHGEYLCLNRKIYYQIEKLVDDENIQVIKKKLDFI